MLLTKDKVFHYRKAW